MNKFFVVLIMMMLSISAFAEKITVKVDGMTCVACVKSVSKELKKLENVDPKSVKVSLEGTQAVFDTKGEVPDSKIRVAIKKAGYKVRKILRK